jgi:hypothetical protein
MKKLSMFFTALAILALFSASASAEAVLSDWCFNVNGDSTTHCNGTGGSPGGTFDTTLSPTANALGSAIVTLGAGSNQYALAYMDYDLNYAAAGSFTDFGTVLGSVPVGFTYELDDPNTSTIFTDFTGNALLNVNNVSTPLGPNDPNGPCCDVAWALGVSGINVPTGQSATVTFVASSTDPGGFRLQETNQFSGESIYLSAAVNIGGGPTIPEPGYTMLLGAGLAGLLAYRRVR